MSDAAPAPAEPVAPVVPAPVAETPPVAAPETATPEVKPDRTFTQAELDEIVEKRLAKERKKRVDIQQERDVLRRLTLEREPAPKQQQEQPKPAAQTGEPTREQFASYEEFIEARATYRAEQVVDRKINERAEADRTAKAQQDQQTAGTEFKKRAKESAAEIADFDEVMSNITATDPVARIAADPIASSDIPGKLLYHLATHPEEAERIASLPVGQQAREVVKLELQLAAEPKATKPSQAPEPIKPVGGKAAATVDEMPDAAKNPDAWMKWRNRSLAAKAGAAKR